MDEKYIAAVKYKLPDVYILKYQSFYLPGKEFYP